MHCRVVKHEAYVTTFKVGKSWDIYKESSELAPYALLSFLALENYEEHLSDYLERTTIKMNNSN